MVVNQFTRTAGLRQRAPHNAPQWKGDSHFGGHLGYHLSDKTYIWTWAGDLDVKFERNLAIQGIFCHSLGAKFRPHSQSKIATFFSQYHVRFSQIKKSKKNIYLYIFFYFFFRDHYYLWETMTRIRMILKHLCLSGMLGIIQFKIVWFPGYILVLLLCSVLLISPNFDV